MPAPIDFSVRLCHARRCIARVAHPRLFCSVHWSLIPTKLQTDIADVWQRDAEGLSALLGKAKDEIAMAERRMTC